MTERWLPIVGHPGYEVSDLGRVRGVDRVVMRTDGFTQKVRGTLISVHLDGFGRPKVLLRSPGRNAKSVRVHSLVLTAFRGPRPEGMEGCHNDGDKLNNRLDNLRWDTRESNVADIVKHGTHWRAGQTHCLRGHEFAGDNLYEYQRNGGTRRACRACRSEYNRRRRVAGQPNQAAA